ncbi:COG4705 family protein [Streptomyces sp. NPDC001153]
MITERVLDRSHAHAHSRISGMAHKVPEVTAYFWIIKVLTTGMGEKASDYLAHLLGPIPAVGLGVVALLGSLVVQFAVCPYVAWVYWTVIVMVSVLGTMAADALHKFGVPYTLSTPLFMVALAVVFALWHASERTLSIHSITTRRHDTFYWDTVLTTFALGTAAGDLSAGIGLGYLGSVVLYAVAICVPAVAYRGRLLGAVSAFWATSVITRSLGASFADWMARDPSHGGLRWVLRPVTLSWTRSRSSASRPVWGSRGAMCAADVAAA